MPNTISTGPFAGVRVLEASTGIGGRTAGMLLADFGAEVVRVLPAGEPAWADQPGFDPVVQALSGLMTAQGCSGAPVHSTAPIHDVGTGILAAFGVLAALFARGTTGCGQHVTTSLAAVSTFLQSAELTDFENRPPAPTGGTDFAGPSPSHGFHRAKDAWLAIVATTPEQVRRLREASGDTGVFATRSVAEWLELLAAKEIPACQVLAVEGELDDPFLMENDFSHLVRDPVLGRLRVVRSYSDWHDTDPLRGTSEFSWVTR